MSGGLMLYRQQSPRDLIRSTVVQQQSRFREMRWRLQQPPQLLVNRELEPLGTLIALSYDPASGGLSTAPEFVEREMCPALEETLAQLWKESQGESSGAASQ
ncbi:MAG: hypothetical protein NTY67_00890 [Cyanobacteria bacterium]|nr:hypothetical protein [Cyanobacteriota bacterium]